MKGKIKRILIGDKEIIGPTSFSISSGPPIKEVMSFTGTFDPVDVPEGIMKEQGRIITGIIHGENNEKKEARLRVDFKDNILSLTPIDDDVKKWVEAHIFGIKA